jgi:ABC-type amino acid transport substrate-binding protein
MQPTPFARPAATAEDRPVVVHRETKSRLAHVRHRTRMAKKRTKPTAVAKANTPVTHAQSPPDKPPPPAAQAAPKEPENTAAQAPTAPPPKTVQEQVAAASADTAPARADPDALVAVVLARLDVKSVADLKAKVVAIDDRYSSSNTNVRTAIVAAGAPEVQLSEGQGTAINRLVNGEVPAAVVDVERAEAAELFPEIAGYRVFHIPLSPGSTKAKP